MKFLTQLTVTEKDLEKISEEIAKKLRREPNTKEQLAELFKQTNQKEEEIKLAKERKKHIEEQERRTKEEIMIQNSFSEGKKLSANITHLFFDGKICLPANLDFPYIDPIQIDSITKYVEAMGKYLTNLKSCPYYDPQAIPEDNEKRLKENTLKSKILQTHIKGFMTKVFDSSDDPYYEPHSLSSLLKLLTHENINSFHKFKDREKIINKMVEILFKKIKDLIEKSKNMEDIEKIKKILTKTQSYINSAEVD